MSINDDRENLDDIQIADAPFDDDALNDWIAGGDVAKTLVIMHGKPHLAAEHDRLQDELRLAKARAGDTGSELGGSETGRLQREIERVYDEWAASRTRWLVRAITDTVVDEADEATRATIGAEPVEPKAPSKDSPKSKRDEHAAALAKFKAAEKAWNDRQKAELIVRVVEHIEFADGRRARVTSADQVAQMRATFGEIQVLKIIAAAREAQLLSPELSAPFSSSTSGDDPT